jgi:hypothetical protein
MAASSLASQIPPPSRVAEPRFDDWMVKLWNLIKTYKTEPGTYTPTLTKTTNIAAVTASPLTYVRTGDMVNVSGPMSIDPTAGSTASVLTISLPFDSVFAATTDGSGLGASGAVAGLVGTVAAVVAGNAVTLNFVSDSGAANHAWVVQFTYQIK